MVIEGQVRRTPRIIQQARLHMEVENERQQQRDLRLHNRRISQMAKRAALSDAEREEILKKRRDAYHLRTIRARQADKDVQEASTSSESPIVPSANDDGIQSKLCWPKASAFEIIIMNTAQITKRIDILFAMVVLLLNQRAFVVVGCGLN